MTELGWYAEPGNPALERYWDGAQWTPMTRPAVVTCAVGPCDRPRVAGKQFCDRHGSGLAPERPAHVAPAAVVTSGVITVQPPPPSGAAALLCPHCGTRGRVKTKTVKQKKGVSGGKATGAILTGGLSLFATGLSRKEKTTELTCGQCRMTWYA